MADECFDTDRFKQIEAGLDEKLARSRAVTAQTRRELETMKKTASDSRTKLAVRVFSDQRTQRLTPNGNGHVNGNGSGVAPPPPRPTAADPPDPDPVDLPSIPPAQDPSSGIYRRNKKGPPPGA